MDVHPDRLMLPEQFNPRQMMQPFHCSPPKSGVAWLVGSGGMDSGLNVVEC